MQMAQMAMTMQMAMEMAMEMAMRMVFPSASISASASAPVRCRGSAFVHGSTFTQSPAPHSQSGGRACVRYLVSCMDG